jgi:GH15 family glucan-1,4-alpha-glucosidase
VADTPIADYALLSDCHSAALVSRSGSIDWLCLPRFDGPASFARILGDRAGHWLIRPVADARISRRYLDRTMVLETTFQTSTGVMTVVDGMAVGRNERGHALGENSPGVLLRQARCVTGSVDVAVEYAPRPEYGLIHPLMSRVGSAIVARGGAAVSVLSCPSELQIDNATASGRLQLHAGDRVGFAFRRTTSWEPLPEAWSQQAIADRLEDTCEGWRTWSALHQSYQGPWADLVHHSGRVLQALTFQPTGAIVAAPTTSLPEVVGGSRNWDYRYTWVRDASLTLEALWVAACPDEGARFFNWMAAAAAADVAETDLQIMFGVGGEHDLTERELTHLPGWRDSRPVRIGNGAWNQRQLDVYGELLSAAGRVREQLGHIDEPTRVFLVEVADTAARRWEERDQGIWEVRGGPRHFLYSKLMCWAAMDWAIRLAGFLGSEHRVDTWSRSRARIREAILGQGWSDRAGAFTQSFGSSDLDASALMIPIVGFLPADDRRVLSTIDAIAAGLTDERGLVYRYRMADGLPGDEGTFLICTFWLAQAQAMAGRVELATRTFENAIAHVNDVGLLSEEVHPATGELLGNFPQAFSHIGLVGAAWAISKAQAQRPTGVTQDPP